MRELDMKTSMKAVKITFLGQPLRSVYPHASKWQVAKYKMFRALRWLLIRTGIAAAAFTALTGAYFYGQLTAPNISASNTIVQAAAAAPVDKIAPVMERIFKAESGNTHFAKNGQIIYNINLHGKKCSECTLDLGLAQINVDIWGKKATELGYDLTKEEDNRAFAMHLYATQGTSPWYSSQGAQNW